MTVKREMAYSIIPIFQQQRKCPHIISTGKSLWTGVSRSILARPCSHRLCRRSRWLCKCSCRWLRRRRCCALSSLLSSISLSFGFQSFLCFLASFFSPATLLTTFLRAALFSLTGNWSCLALLTPFLKMELALVLVRLWSFLFHSIHNYNNTFNVRRKLYSQKVQFPQVSDIAARMRDGGGRPSDGSTVLGLKPKSRWRRA